MNTMPTEPPDSSRLIRRCVVLGCVVLLVASGAAFTVYGRGWWVPLLNQVRGRESVESALAEYGEDARARLVDRFDAVQMAYPPGRVWLLGIKSDAQLELWASSGEASDGSEPVLIHTYPILALSGKAGPKLREGDRQVPEGVYRVEGLNPNSSYHLSIKLNYPNAWDRTRAAADGRDRPGSNIFIHGKAQSVGCLAMGDPAIEELFVLVADTGLDRCEVFITPRHPRVIGWNQLPREAPSWTAQLYEKLEAAMREAGVLMSE